MRTTLCVLGIAVGLSVGGSARAADDDPMAATLKLHADAERATRAGTGGALVGVGAVSSALGIYLLAQSNPPIGGYLLAGGGGVSLVAGALVYFTSNGMESLYESHAARRAGGASAADAARATEAEWTERAGGAKTGRTIGGLALLVVGVIGVGVATVFTVASPFSGLSGKEMRGYAIGGMIAGAAGTVGGAYFLTHESTAESSLAAWRLRATPTVGPGTAGLGVSTSW